MAITIRRSVTAGTPVNFSTHRKARIKALPQEIEKQKQIATRYARISRGPGLDVADVADFKQRAEDASIRVRSLESELRTLRAL